MAFGYGFADAIMQYAVPDLEALSIELAGLPKQRDRLAATFSNAGYDLVPLKGPATFGLVVHSFELVTCARDDIGNHLFQSRMQLRFVEVAIVADPAGDARVVHLGQFDQGFAAAVMQRPTANFAADAPR